MNYSNGWHVLYVKSRWEKRVYESLKENELESFLPQLHVLKQWSDRKKLILKPLIPSYVFVYLNSLKEFHKALSINGACSYISFGRNYAHVTEKEIGALKCLVNDENIKVLDIDQNIPKKGQIKKIVSGPLTNLDCEILKVNNENKIIVRIDSLQQNFIATVPANYLYEIPELASSN